MKKIPTLYKREFSGHKITGIRDEIAPGCEAALTEYLTALVADHGSVRSTLCTARQAGDVLTVTLTAECEEQIGERVPIYTETAVKTP